LNINQSPQPSWLSLAWVRQAPASARRALLAASLGWMLDSFDILLYALILPSVMASLHLTKARAGLLGSLTLVAAAVGGVLFGLAADRWGRTRALMASILVYAIFTAACGLAWSFLSLACFRILLGFGMGGEWASGASLVAETWPAVHRDKALALMQSAFAVGYALAAIVAFALLPRVGWRGVFFVGVAPALLTLWIRRNVREPEAWQAAQVARGNAPRAAFADGLVALFRPPLVARTMALTAMNACCMFAWWGFNLWVPSYLSLPMAQGGIGLTARAMTVIIVAMQVGMWFGYVSFGYLATAFGRKRVYVSFLLAAAVLLTIFAQVRSPWLLVLLGPCLAYAATGYFSGFAAVTAEAYPTRIRSTAQGLTYNAGRLASAIAPYTAGAIAERQGFGAALHLDAVAFVVAAALWIFLPSHALRSAEDLVPNHLPLT
jgi:MFS family permease